jgi:hypothetical protein
MNTFCKFKALLILANILEIIIKFKSSYIESRIINNMAYFIILLITIHYTY